MTIRKDHFLKRPTMQTEGKNTNVSRFLFFLFHQFQRLLESDDGRFYRSLQFTVRLK